MNSIFEHPSGARLWQGDMSDVRNLLNDPHDEIRVIGLFAREYQPNDRNEHYEMIKLGFEDTSVRDPIVLSKISNYADHASDMLADRLRRGVSAMSSCAAGINRSGLVTALTLMKLTGKDPSRAIQQVRERRGEHWGMTALANPRFVEIVHQMHDVAGLKEAWTVWMR